MRTALLLLFACSLMLLTGCENDNGGPSSRFSVRIAGTTWNASQVYATQVTAGGSTTRTLTATGPNNEIFSIQVLSTSSGNLTLDDVASTSTASVSYTQGTTLYTAVSGNMNVTNNNDGNFSATFSGSVQSSDGSVTLELSSGSIINVRTIN